jgi:hypothetical protein
MDLNSSASEGEQEQQPDDACVILEVKQPVKRRKPKPIGQYKKGRGKARVVKPPISMPRVGRSKRKRYNSESEEAVSDTESEDDAAGKEGRLQRRAINRNRKCITDPEERKQFDALPPDQQLLYAPKRTRKQTPVLNIATTKGIANKTYDEARDEDEEESVSSEHDTDNDYKAKEKPLPPIVVPPKKRKTSAQPCDNKRRSLDDILKKVSVPISPPAPPVTPPAPPSTALVVPPPATPPPKAVPAKKPVAVAKWRQREQAPQLAIDTVALGRPIHGDVGMLNASRAPQQQPQKAPQQPAPKVGTLVYYDAWALKGFPDYPLAEKALAEHDRSEYVRKHTTTEPVLGALPRSLTEYVREPLPPPAAHLQPEPQPSAPPAWPALEWKRVPATPRTPQRYWNRGGSAVVGPSQPPRPRSPPPRDRHDPRFEPRFGPDSDRRRCFDWRFDRDRRPRW